MSIVDRIRKYFGFHVHTWGKWENEGTLVRITDKSVVGEIQTRKCAECGKQEYNKCQIIF